MPTMSLPMIKGDKHGADVEFRDAIPVNIYGIEKNIFGSSGYLTNYPGIKPFGTGAGRDRGAVYNVRFKQHYRVSGDRLLSIGESGEQTVVGTVPGIDQASMPYSFNKQAVIANGRAFLYSPSPSVFTEITSSNLGSPIDGAWIDGFFVFCDRSHLYHTNLSDESVIGSTSFATAELFPDETLGVLRTHDNNLAVFGRYTTSFMRNLGLSNFVFQRLEGREHPVGIVSTHAKTEIDARIYVLGGGINTELGAYQMTHGSVEKISTREIDKVINSYSESQLLRADIRVESLSINATTFVVFHLPERTLLYNPAFAATFGSNNAWSFLSTGGYYNRYNAINPVFDGRIGKWIAGDITGNPIGILSQESSVYYDNPVYWEVTTPIVKFDGLSIDRIEIETIPGYNDSGETRINLSATSDGVFYGPQEWRTYSAPGDYGVRFYRRRIGYIGDFISFRLRSASRDKIALSNFQVVYG